MRRYGAVIVILITAIGAMAEAQVVDIPDANLKAAIKQELGIGHDPTAADMLQLTVLGASDRGISDLTGLEHATNLDDLRMTGNAVSDLGPLTGLTNLTGLDVGGNLISDISPLAGKYRMVDLHLWGNRISDITPLAGMTELMGLNLCDNRISSIHTLAEMTKLERLFLCDNQITEISDLEYMTELELLWLNGNNIEDIRLLSHFKKLQSLTLRGPFSSLEPLSELTTLTELEVSDSQVTELSALSGLKNLTYLGMSFNQINDISGISELTNLERLWLSFNHITDVSALSGMKELSQLILGENQITNISPLDGLDKMTSMELSGNPIRDISALAGMVDLQDVSAGGCGFQDISALANMRRLYFLNIEANPLDATAYTVYIPQILANNPGIELHYDEPFWRTLTIASSEGGSVITPGEGVFRFVDGQVVTIEAVLADTAHRFDRWSGSATTVSRRGRVADPLARETTVLVDGDYTLEAVFAARDQGPALGITLGEIDVDEPAQYYGRIVTNNAPGTILVEHVTGVEPDPNGMIHMQVIEGESARAKASFGACTTQRILVRFDYLFESPDDIEFVVYLSDVPELIDHNSRQYNQHYVEIGRIPAPPAGRPGSAGSERFATFETWTSTGRLDLSNGTWVELELVSASTTANMRSIRNGVFRLAGNGDGAPASAYVDNCAAEVHCDGICMDLNLSTTADEEDFLLVIAACGREAGLIDDGQDSLKCLDGIFTSDGYVDSHDIHPWSWALYDETRKNFCPELPLREDSEALKVKSMSSPNLGRKPVRTLASVAELPGELMVMGKRRMSGQYTLSDLVGDCLCLFEDDLTFVVDYAEAGVPREGNIRAVTGPGQSLYLINSEQGILQIDDNVTSIVPAGTVTYADEPRSQSAATIQIGIQDNDGSSSGRPILDAAFDSDGNIHVVPVVVQPEGKQVYEAAAKLRLQTGADPPYEVVQLFDDPPPANDNQYRDHLREIEVDSEGNVYLVNAHALNESCIVWKYASDGTLLKRLDLLGPNSPAKITDPLAMHVSDDGQTLYLASGQCHWQDPNDSILYKLSTTDFSLVGTITIQNMRQITAITEAPGTGTLWIVGFNMSEIPEFPNPLEPFYIPALAEVPVESDIAQAVPIADPLQHNLVLPTSISWTGEE